GDISARYDTGFENLYLAIARELTDFYLERWIFVPWDDASAWQRIYQDVQIIQRQDTEDGARLLVRAPAHLIPLLTGVEESP
ncbi:MAG: hypothetical protein M1596_01350, partial [Firmicutes bacterium]|nr:hypothetical protein [Bacillota bacterium]